MKHNFFFKFLAILLCSASLLGTVGGAAGAMVLVEGDLYHKTVDEVITQRQQLLAQESAREIALQYADQVLGGCPEEIIRFHGEYSLSDSFTTYGYSLLDGEGNVLTSFQPELKDSAEVYTVPVTGQYMYLVSRETETEQLARETAARMDAIANGLVDQDGQSVPPDGIPVNQVIFTDSQGVPIYEATGDRTACSSTFYYNDVGTVRSSSSYEHEPTGQIGFLYYGTDGQLLYRSFLEEWDHNFSTAEVYGLLFQSQESGFCFRIDSPEALGILMFENGHLCFSGYPTAEVPVDSQPAQTVPETTAETAPQETVAETQPVEETKPIEETQEEKASEDAEESEEHEEETKAEESSEEEASEEKKETSSASAVPEEDSQEETEEDSQEETEEDSHAEDAEDAEDSEDSEETAAYEETEVTVPVPPETLPAEVVVMETAPEETVPEETAPTLINGKPLEYYQVNKAEYYDSRTDERCTAKYVYLPLPEMTVEVYVAARSIKDTAIYDVLRVLRDNRNSLLPLIGICLLMFVLSAIYLCTAAGRSSKTEEIQAGGLNRLPLDLYLGMDCLLIAAFAALTMVVAPRLLGSDFLFGCSLALGSVFVCCLIFVGFCYAFVAQLKTPGGYWWRNLLGIRFVCLCIRLLQGLKRWFLETSFPWLLQRLKKLWGWIQKCLRWLCEVAQKLSTRISKQLNRFFSLIPLTWQWVLCGLLLLCLLLIAVTTHNAFLNLLCLAASLALVLYGCHCFGLLLESTRRMSKGNLDTKVEHKHMLGCFRDFANDLNALADVAVVAAQKQLKSERMKTELITNVSHDIKTPLTSIINYVDLLQKPHTEEDGVQYLEVLDRQSQRLKKLIEDLMDMSKASTGNMTVEITRLDAVESVNQALGEFADKLERARLYPVVRHSEESLPMLADGKLVWRVLSNLLGNVVKYGMPGTRIYLDLIRMNGNVIISLKNISREELNVDAEELMERFVRGDASRNTEGSGLGLNIAKSLMELQKGQLQLLVDGDLFKVTLIFPEAR